MNPLYFALMLFLPFRAETDGSGYEKFYPDRSKCVAETHGRLSVQPCERVLLEFPELAGRAEAWGMGATGNGDIHAFVVATVGAAGAMVRPGQRLFRSSDGGRSWTSRPISLKAGVGTGFVILPDDTMLLAANASLPDDRGAVIIYESKNQGESWSEISRVLPNPYSVITAESLSRMNNGILLLPADRLTKTRASESLAWNERLKDYHHLVFRSSDGGKTWKEGGRTYDGMAETHVIELQPGRLLGAFRFSGAHRDWHPLKAQTWGAASKPDNAGRIFKHVFLGDSDDGGLTWNAQRPVVDKAGRPLVVFGETHGQLVKLTDRKVVLVSDHRYPYELGETVAWLSLDGGRTWTGTKYHLSAGSGYAASVTLRDGTILTVTGTTRLDAKSKPVEPWKVQAIRWKP